MPTADIAAGQILDGRFLLTAKLRQGGMAVVGILPIITQVVLFLLLWHHLAHKR